MPHGRFITVRKFSSHNHYIFVNAAAHVPIVAEVNGRLAITFERWKGATDISYTVEMSSDLHTWTEVQTVENVLDNGDGTQTVTISDDLPLLGMPRRFVRIGISSL